jgi:hypothetical protein
VDRAEKAMELLKRATKLGLRVEFQSGMNILKKTAPVDPELLTSMMEQLANYLPEIRAISQRRAVAALGKNLASRRIWSKEHGEGTLVGASEDGMLTISVGIEMRRSDEEEIRRSRTSITSNAESLLVLVEDQENSTSFPNDQTVPEKSRRGIFGFLGRGLQES